MNLSTRSVVPLNTSKNDNTFRKMRELCSLTMEPLFNSPIYALYIFCGKYSRSLNIHIFSTQHYFRQRHQLTRTYSHVDIIKMREKLIAERYANYLRCITLATLSRSIMSFVLIAVILLYWKLILLSMIVSYSSFLL